MKKLATSLLYFASTLFIHTYGQIENWRDLTPSSDRNFFEIQQAFEMEFGGVSYEKGRGIKQYRRWEYYWENRVDINGNFPRPGKVLEEFNNYLESHPTPRNYVSGNGNWSLMGPIQKPLNGTGQPNGNGRVNSITFHPTDTNVIILGTPGGGVFKSNDKGNSWNELNNGLIRLGVSDIDYHPTVPDTIYIATGDKDGGDSPGYGVWRSSDGGNSWNAHNTGMGDRTVFEILMHPNNPRIMFASTGGQKFYRSTDGGETWINTYNFNSNCKDLAFHPTNPNIIYAAGPEFYRSTDNGLTFTEVNSGLPTPVCRIAIGVSPNQPDWVYLFAGGATGSGSFEGIYRSTDAGQNFSIRTSTPNIMGYNSAGNDDRDQCWYDICLAVDPNNANILYAGSINIWKSVDGGTTMTLAAHWTGSGGADDVHADQHDLQYSPHDGKLYNANDGGIYFTADSGTTWDEISSGLYIAQVYKIGVAQITKDLVINGYQDNGTAINNGSSFRTEIGGDGFESIIDPLDENFMYGALYYGDVRRSNNGGYTFSVIASNGVNGINESGAWVAPYTLDPNNNARMYIGYKNVWRSNDVKSPGTNAITWAKISNFGSSGNLIDIAVAPSDSNILYVSKSLDGSRLFKTNNATATSPAFSSLHAGLPNNTNVKDIAVDPVNPNHIFIAQSNKIYESTNGGVSWTDVSGTLPDISLNTIVLDYESSLGAMYVGMDLGIYYKDNSMADWVLYSDSLPNVEITELEIHYSSTDCNSKLYASTYGQGLWASDLKDPGNQAPIACFEANQTSTCVSDVITLIDHSSFSPLSWSWSISPNTYSYVNGTDSSSQNPSILFMSSGDYTITLAATNSNGTNSVTKTNYLNVLPSNYACAYDENFDTQVACGTSTDCEVEICNLASNWANLTNGSVDDIDWRTDSAGTVSLATGPSVDFSLGTSSGIYLYLEASGGCTQQTAILESGCIELNQNYNLLVRYHMLGSDMGSLHFDIYSNGLWTQDFVSAITGDQGNTWLTKNIDLSSYNGQTVKLRIRGVTGQGFASDLAIDALEFQPIAPSSNPVSACDSLVSPSGNYVWNVSGSYTDTITGSSGCDSIIAYNLTINSSTSTNQSFSGCDSYVYNGTTYTTSSTVTENLSTVNGCDSIVSTTITINPLPNAPIANSVSIVAGNTATLNASGAGSGQSYAWLTSNGTPVGNGASFTTPVLNTTTIYYVEIVDNTSNCSSNRTTVIVTVTTPDILWTGNTSNDWNVASNWSTNFVPSLSDSVIIQSNNVVNYPIIQSDITIGHTTVDSLASIIIAPSGILHLSEELVNNGLVLLQSDMSGDGVLMDTLPNASFIGSLSIERYNPGDQFHIIGSPVASLMTGLSNDLSGPTGNGLTGSDGIAVTPDLTTSFYLNSGVCDSLVVGSNYGNLFSYDESLIQNCSFEGWVVESAGTLVPGKGYMAYLTPGGTLDLDGPPNTGSITGPSLTNSGGTTFSGAGWNLVSNPYPSFFDVEEFVAVNNGVNSPNVFVDTGLYSGTYSSILPVTGQSIVALGQGFVIRNGGDNATSSINAIYSNAMRETSGTGFRSPASTRLKVDVIQENLRDKTEIYWAQAGHESFYRLEDGYKFTGSTHQPQIGSLLEDKLMAVQTLPKSEDLSRIIPLVVNGIETSMYSIEVDPDFIPLDYHVFLVDNINGQRYNARILPEISFQNLGNEERRFDIEIMKSSLNADNLDFLENIEVYQSNDQLIVAPQNASEVTYRIEVYDILGRHLMSKPLTAGRQVISLNTPSQLLNIRLSSGAHQHIVKTWWQVD